MVAILQCAEEWGVPPWEVTGEEPTDGVRVEWFKRRAYYTHQNNLKREQERMKLEMDARMKQHGNWGA